MKTTTLLLIFSGLTGLNKCSNEIKIDLPFFPVTISPQNNEEKYKPLFFESIFQQKTDSLSATFFINSDKKNESFFKNKLILPEQTI